MSDPVKGRRRYDASRRREQARQTRRAVLAAAHDLFVSEGYGRTTIAAVARAAGVSPETVYGAFGSKAGLLHRVWDVTIGGDDERVVFHERPEVLAVRAEPDLARRFARHAELFTATARRIMPFVLAVQRVAGSEPAAAALMDEVGRQRRAGMAVMARDAAATGRLAVTEAECRDVVWATTDGMLWQRLVVDSHWPDERFARWLGQLWVATLVAPPHPD